MKRKIIRTIGAELPAGAGQPGAEPGADAKGYERGAWIIEQQCGHSKKLSGDIEEITCRVVANIKEITVRKELERRDIDLSM